MNNLSQYSTCYELLSIKDNKDNEFVLWAFPQENLIRAYYNGFYLHEEQPYFEELPRFEV